MSEVNVILGPGEGKVWALGDVQGATELRTRQKLIVSDLI